MQREVYAAASIASHHCAVSVMSRFILFYAAVDCGNLTDGYNARVAYTTTTYRSSANYSCLEGHTISSPGGNQERQCQANGSWSDEPLRCTSEQFVVFCYHLLAIISSFCLFPAIIWPHTCASKQHPVQTPATRIPMHQCGSCS